MRLPPQRRAQEAPLQELPADDREPLDVAPGADHRHDAGAFVPYLDHAEAVVESAPQGQDDPVDEHDAGGRGPYRSPEDPGQRVPDERDPIGQLVGEGEGDGEVGVKVHGPPGLVAHPRVGGSERGHPGHHQQAEGDRRHEDVRVGGEQDAQLVQGTDRGLLRVADGDEDGVGSEQDDRPRPYPAVPAHEAVLAENTFQPGQPRDQEQHHEEQVAPREAEELAGRDREPTWGGEAATCHIRQSETERGAESDGDDRSDGVGRPLGPTGPRVYRSLAHAKSVA